MNDLNTDRQKTDPPDTEPQEDAELESPRHQKPNIFQIVLSTFAAAFGVQSNKNRERDFQGGSLTTYIVSGVVFTVLFVFAVLFVVRLVLAASGI